MKTLARFVAGLLLASLAQAAGAQPLADRNDPAGSPAVDLPLRVSNNAGKSVLLRFGLDPSATDSIDVGLGEAELPPYPPSEVFEARFIGADIGINLGQGVLKDYRKGGVPPTGEYTYELRYQAGTGNAVAVEWNLPAGVTGRMQDFVTGSQVDIAMRGADSAEIPRPGVFTKLRLTVHWEVTGSALDRAHPALCKLAQNYPNPFNPVTLIPFQIAGESRVRLTIFNALGQEVERLIERTAPGGSYEVAWRPRCASGVYFCRMEARLLQAPGDLVVQTICMILNR